jgi:hypothetical protein
MLSYYLSNTKKKGTTMKIKEKMPCSNVKWVLGQTSKGKQKTNSAFCYKGILNISMAKLGAQDGNHLRGQEMKPRPKLKGT